MRILKIFGGPANIVVTSCYRTIDNFVSMQVGSMAKSVSS